MEDFRREVLRVKGKRKVKISHSLGVYDAYKWIRKNKWLGMNPISEHDFYAIIRGVNKALAEYFLYLGEISLPERMGKLVLRKYPVKIALEKGKIKTNLPIDWDSTLKLWAEDKESYANRTLIRAEEKELFKILYDKSDTLYNNKSFYHFNVNRELKKRVKEKLKEGKLDAFMLCGKI